MTEKTQQEVNNREGLAYLLEMNGEDFEKALREHGAKALFEYNGVKENCKIDILRFDGTTKDNENILLMQAALTKTDEVVAIPQIKDFPEKLKKIEVALRVVEASAAMVDPTIREIIRNRLASGENSVLGDVEVISPKGRGLAVYAPFEIDSKYLDAAREKVNSVGDNTLAEFPSANEDKITSNDQMKAYLQMRIQQIVLERTVGDPTKPILSRRSDAKLTGSAGKMTNDQISEVINEVNSMLSGFFGDEWGEDQDAKYNSFRVVVCKGEMPAVCRVIGIDNRGQTIAMKDYLGREIVLASNARDNKEVAGFRDKTQFVVVESEVRNDGEHIVNDSNKKTRYSVSFVKPEAVTQVYGVLEQVATDTAPREKDLDYFTEMVEIAKVSVDGFLQASHLATYFEQNYGSLVRLLEKNSTQIELAGSIYGTVAAEIEIGGMGSSTDVSGASMSAQHLQSEFGMNLPDFMQPYLEQTLKLADALGALKDNVAGDSIDINICSDETIKSLGISISTEAGFDQMTPVERAIFFTLASRVLFFKYLSDLDTASKLFSDLDTEGLKNLVSQLKADGKKIPLGVVGRGLELIKNDELMTKPFEVKSFSTKQHASTIDIVKAGPNIYQAIKNEEFQKNGSGLEAQARSAEGYGNACAVTAAEISSTTSEFGQLLSKHIIQGEKGISIEFNGKESQLADEDPDEITTFVLDKLKKIGLID